MNHSVEESVKSYREKHNLPIGGGKTEAVERKRDDPYEVMDEKYTMVSYKEYIEPLNKGVSFGFSEYKDISEHIEQDPRRPLSDYTHDPIHLINALILGCNIEHCARSAASTIPYKNLQTVENNDTTKIVEFIRDSKEAREQVHEATGEYIYSLMAVKAASDNLPTGVVKEILTKK